MFIVDELVKEYPNAMSFSGNHLFHYTTLDSAVKIILTNTLNFGRFHNMNDIAEVRRELYDKYGSNRFEQAISKYQSISLTLDTSHMERGFAIDSLWGYYADKGNGVCLVFDRSKILNEYYKLCRKKRFSIPHNMKVEYVEYFINTNFVDLRTKRELEDYVKENIQDLFYKKAQFWQHEKEFRFVIKSEAKVSLGLSDSLIGAIICVPREDNYKNSEQYRLLSKLQTIRKFPIYYYGINFGTRILKEDGVQLWPILEKDYNIDVNG